MMLVIMGVVNVVSWLLLELVDDNFIVNFNYLYT